MLIKHILMFHVIGNIINMGHCVQLAPNTSRYNFGDFHAYAVGSEVTRIGYKDKWELLLPDEEYPDAEFSYYIIAWGNEDDILRDLLLFKLEYL